MFYFSYSVYLLLAYYAIYLLIYYLPHPLECQLHRAGHLSVLFTDLSLVPKQCEARK